MNIVWCRYAVPERTVTKSKSFYKYVRSRQRKKDRVGPITDNQGRVLIKDEKVAEAISKYFGSVYEKEEGGDVPVAATMFKGEMSTS